MLLKTDNIWKNFQLNYRNSHEIKSKNIQKIILWEFGVIEVNAINKSKENATDMLSPIARGKLNYVTYTNFNVA